MGRGGGRLTGTVLAAAALLLAALQTGQAQSVDNSLRRSLDACQKVVKRHLVLAEASITSAIAQVTETTGDVKDYVERWGARVEAGASPDHPEAGVKIRACLAGYADKVADVVHALADKLHKTVDSHVLWYDGQMFSLFTDVVSEVARDAVVSKVQDYLEPTLKQFNNVIVAGLKQTMNDIKPGFQNVSSCIRRLSLEYDYPYT